MLLLTVGGAVRAGLAGAADSVARGPSDTDHCRLALQLFVRNDQNFAVEKLNTTISGINAHCTQNGS